LGANLRRVLHGSHQTGDAINLGTIYMYIREYWTDFKIKTLRVFLLKDANHKDIDVIVNMVQFACVEQK